MSRTIKTPKYSTRNKQRGLSSLAWLVIILVVGFFGICAFKLIPVYADNVYATNALSSLSELERTSGGFRGVTKADIDDHLRNYFNINNLRAKVVTDSVDIDMRSEKFVVTMNYERRIPLIYNIDVVVHFENYFDSSRPHECCKPPSE